MTIFGQMYTVVGVHRRFHVLYTPTTVVTYHSRICSAMTFEHLKQKIDQGNFNAMTKSLKRPTIQYLEEPEGAIFILFLCFTTNHYEEELQDCIGHPSFQTLRRSFSGVWQLLGPRSFLRDFTVLRLCFFEETNAKAVNMVGI